MKSYSTAWTLAAATKKLNNKCVSLCAHCPAAVWQICHGININLYLDHTILSHFCTFIKVSMTFTEWNINPETEGTPVVSWLV